jgi:L-ascorbate metabolism protein UlaG (beta-lactamase superfamily)
MKITKYPQSCFVFEDKGAKIMIDPGSFFAQKYKAEDFLDVKAVLITHNHTDHMDVNALKVFAGKDIPIYGNADVVNKLAEAGINASEVKDKAITISGFEIEPVHINHADLAFCCECNSWVKAENRTRDFQCKLHPDKKTGRIPAPPNTCYHINHLFFHPGDAIHSHGHKFRNVAVQIEGASTNNKDAWNFIVELDAKLVVPMHYENQYFHERDPYEFAKKNPGLDIEVKILKDGESIEIG